MLTCTQVGGQMFRKTATPLLRGMCQVQDAARRAAQVLKKPLPSAKQAQL